MARIKRKMKLKEIADAIGVSYTTLADRRAKSKDFPRILRGNIYDAEEVCRWIVTHATLQSAMSRGAEDYLARLKGDKSAEKPPEVGEKQPDFEKNPQVSGKKSQKVAKSREKSKESAETPEKPPETPSMEVVDTITRDLNVSTGDEDYTGFAQHVQWLGMAMVDTWRRYQNALAEEDEAGIQSATRTYNVQLETLRKAESSRVELETALGKLVLRDEAKQKFTALCVNIKSKLMPLGAKLCHELCNQRSAKKVKDIIDSEVRDILAAVADQPF